MVAFVKNEVYYKIMVPQWWHLQMKNGQSFALIDPLKEFEKSPKKYKKGTHLEKKKMFLWYLTLIFIFISINFELCILDTDTLEYEMKKKEHIQGCPMVTNIGKC